MKIAFGERRWWLLGVLVLGNISVGCAGKHFEPGGESGGAGQSGVAQAGSSGTAGSPEVGGMSGTAGTPAAGGMSGGGSGMAGSGGTASCQVGEVLGCASAKELKICKEDGTFFSQPCAAEKPICTDNGACVECLIVDDCKGDPGPCNQKNCTPQRTCEDVPLALGTDCGSGKVCNGNGVCGDCQPGMKRCSNDKVELCDSNGNWLPDGTCSEQGLICGAGECSAPKNIVSGESHSCLRLENGALFCWGSNSSAQVGAATLKVTTPYEIKSLGKVETMSAGTFHTCAVKNGEVYCWGNNSDFQLGNAQSGNSPNPVKVQGISDVVKIATANIVTCAITIEKKLYCWGSNFYGHLGNSNWDSNFKTEKPSLVPLASVEEIAISAFHACAITSETSNRNVYCWGLNFVNFGGGISESSSLGDGDGTQHKQLSPNLVSYTGLVLPEQLVVGYRSSCVRVPNPSTFSDLKCWGDTSFISEILPSFDLFFVGYGDYLLRYSLGVNHICTSSGSGGVSCKGSNKYGQVGNGSVTAEPVSVWAKLSGIPAEVLALGSEFSCMIHRSLSDPQDTHKYVYCWGKNDKGQLGIGSMDLVFKPGPTIYTKGILSKRQIPVRCSPDMQSLARVGWRLRCC
jgi:hypothetical protein